MAAESTQRTPAELIQIRPGVFINPSAVAMAECIHTSAYETMPRDEPSTKQMETYALALSLVSGVSVVLTDKQEIAAATKALGLPDYKTWKPKSP